MSTKGKAARWQVELLKLRADLAIAREALRAIADQPDGEDDGRIARDALAKIGEGE